MKMRKYFGYNLWVGVWFCFLCGCGVLHKEQPVSGPTTGVHIATVHTTAQNTALRLTNSGNITFAPATQPLETDICVFVY
jgi:hypothetical protein